MRGAIMSATRCVHTLHACAAGACNAHNSSAALRRTRESVTHTHMQQKRRLRSDTLFALSSTP